MAIAAAESLESRNDPAHVENARTLPATPVVETARPQVRETVKSETAPQ